MLNVATGAGRQAGRAASALAALGLLTSLGCTGDHSRCAPVVDVGQWCSESHLCMVDGVPTGCAAPRTPNQGICGLGLDGELEVPFRALDEAELWGGWDVGIWLVSGDPGAAEISLDGVRAVYTPELNWSTFLVYRWPEWPTGAQTLKVHVPDGVAGHVSFANAQCMHDHPVYPPGL